MTSQGQIPSGPSRSDASGPLGTFPAGPESAGRARIAIANKHPVVRLGLKELIVRDERFQFVAAVANGGKFLRLLEERPIDVAVVGWSLPDMTGADLLCVLKRQRSPVRLIIYTGADVLAHAVKFGARGFVSTNNEPADVLRAIAAVVRGRMSFPYVDMQTLSQSPIRHLTAREYELMADLAEGMSNAQIAAHCGISRNTVKHHLKNIYEKLNVTSRAMAVALFMSLSKV